MASSPKKSSRLRRLLPGVVGIAVACLLLVELTARIHMFGFRALDWRWMNSMTHLWETDFVLPAESPRIYYKLRPNLDTTFRGARFVTNSAGLPDREYSLEKPANTFRAVVVGSSWTMPSGISVDRAWHSLLEDDFNEASSRTRFEFINFGLEHYGLGEIVATLELEAMAWDPDLIVFAVTEYAPRILWEDERPAFEPSPRKIPFLTVRSMGYFKAGLRHLDARLGLGLPLAGSDRRNRVNDAQEYDAQLRRMTREVARIAEGKQVPVALVLMGLRALDPEARTTLEEEVRRHRFTFIDTHEALRESGLSRAELLPFPASFHPNATGHRLMADRIEAELLEHGLLPTD